MLRPCGCRGRAGSHSACPAGSLPREPLRCVAATGLRDAGPASDSGGLATPPQRVADHPEAAPRAGDGRPGGRGRTSADRSFGARTRRLDRSRLESSKVGRHGGPRGPAVRGGSGSAAATPQGDDSARGSGEPRPPQGNTAAVRRGQGRDAPTAQDPRGPGYGHGTTPWGRRRGPPQTADIHRFGTSFGSPREEYGRVDGREARGGDHPLRSGRLCAGPEAHRF